MNMNKLNARILDSGMTIDEVAELIGINGFSLYCKMKHPVTMTVGDAMKLKEVLNLSNQEARDIFL